MSLFGGMRIYTVHARSDIARSGEKPVFVREGFNPYAFFFTFVWALSHRLWACALFIVAGFSLIIELGNIHLISQPSIVVLQLALQVAVGYLAGDMQRKSLRRRGYITVDVTAGDSLLRAEQRYFERYISTLGAQ